MATYYPDGYEFMENASNEDMECFVHEHNLALSIKKRKSRRILLAHLYAQMLKKYYPKTFKVLEKAQEHYEMIQKLKETNNENDK